MNNLDERDLLARELRERAGDVAGHPVSFTAVRASAKRLQRRRRVVTGAVAAAVTSIALPTGVAVTAALNDNGTDNPGYVAGPSASADPTGASTATALAPPGEPATLTLDGLPRGDAPKVPYFTADGVVLPDGSRLRTDATYQAIARYDLGWIALGVGEVVFLDADGDVVDSSRAGESLLATPDGERLAYTLVAEDGTQTLVDAPVSGAEPTTWVFPERPYIRPVGFVGDRALAFTSELGGEAEVFTVEAGGEPQRVPGLLSASDAGNGLVAGVTARNKDGSVCSGVVEAASGDLLWEDCDYSVDSFSPNGTWLRASGPYQSGFGELTTSILDARTGAPIAEFEQENRRGQVTLGSTAWETDDAFLATVMDGRRWSILRFDTSGSLESTIEPVEAEPFGDWPFWFSSSR